MTVLTIRTIGDPVLRTRADEVTRFDAGLQRLVEDMHETMLAVGGVGLAAPQIGVGLRVFTWEIDGSAGHIVNPVLTVSEEMQEGSEGCLSVPAIGSETPRSMHASVTGVTVDGEPITVEGSGLLARCLQHETDHLEGKLYLDRLSPENRREVMRALRSEQWESEAHKVAQKRTDPALTPTGRGGSFFGGGQ